MVKVFAPVNIAWIKYMGKTEGAPTNSSFSMTLKHLGTETQIRKISNSDHLSFSYSASGYVPPKTGQEKSYRFLMNAAPWSECLSQFGFQNQATTGTFEVTTLNNVPAGTGIATSASGFAALTLAWFGILVGDRYPEWFSLYRSSPKLRAAIARVSALGSGSSCRSFGGPFVEWDPKNGVSEFHDGIQDFTDFVLLIDSETKEVSSSEAHERVKTSPLFEGRVERADVRLTQVKNALREGHLQVLTKTVLDEAIDMHELFHTSEPPFSYWREQSRVWINRLRNQEAGLPTPNGILTLDAGANVHLFVPTHEAQVWESYLGTVDPSLRFLSDQSGKGAFYHD